MHWPQPVKAETGRKEDQCDRSSAGQSRLNVSIFQQLNCAEGDRCQNDYIRESRNECEDERERLKERPCVAQRAAGLFAGGAARWEASRVEIAE